MYKFTEKEMNELMKGFTIKVDTRENKNEHILRYFAEKKIAYDNTKMDTGDYGAYIKANPELGIMRDLHISGVVERKTGFNEITSNLQKDTQTAFENELIRSKDIPFTILIEDPNGYYNMITGNYRSKYKPESLLGRLNSFKARYGFEMVYIDKMLTGNWIYYHLYYQAKNFLKKL